MNSQIESKEIKTLKKEIAYFMRRLYKRGLTTTFGGNISVRFQDFVLITASQTDKGRMKAADICVLNPAGYQLDKKLKISMETAMHLAIYSARPNVSAIVHAHPPVSSSFSVSHQNINTRLTAEAWAVLGDVARADYALMGTAGLAQTVSNAIANAAVVVMDNHGVLAVGQSLTEAFDRVEVLENAAKIHILSKLSGQQTELTPMQIQAITKIIGL